MARTRRSWLLGALLALPMVIAPAVLAFLIRAPAELPIIARRAATKSEIAAESRRQAYAEKARQRALERYNTWHGTQLYGRGADDPVARAFNSDPPPPEQRLVYFAPFIDGEPQYKCVGWSVNAVSVTTSENGWEAMVHVRPQLAQREGGGVLYTPGATIETWQIAADGTATVLDVQFGSGRGVIFGD